MGSPEKKFAFLSLEPLWKARSISFHLSVINVWFCTDRREKKILIMKNYLPFCLKSIGRKALQTSVEHTLFEKTDVLDSVFDKGGKFKPLAN